MKKEEIKLLVVEDDDAIREGIAELLTLEGFRVTDSKNGKEALDILVDSEQDLVISDIMMPIMDGYTLLENYKNLPGNNNIPFLFLTAFADNSSIRKGMNLGADDYLTKPFSRIELLNAIQTQYEKYSNRKKVFEEKASEEFNKIFKESEKERETMMMEMHHRVKNNLAVVTAFFELGEMSNDPDFINNIKNRILTMASVHEDAYNNELICKVSTDELIQNIISSLFDDDKTLFCSQIERFMIDIEKAIPLGLFLYETLTLVLNQQNIISPIRLCIGSYLTIDKACLSISINSDIELDIFNSDSKMEVLLIQNYISQLDGIIRKQYNDTGSQFFLEYPIN